MKVLIATPLYPPDIGGPATYAKLLEEELPKRGIELALETFGSVRHLPKGFSHISYFIQLFRSSYGCDAILALDPVSVGLPALLAAKLRGKKLVVKIVGDYAWEQGRQRYGVKEELDEFVRRPDEEYRLPVRILRWAQWLVARYANKVMVPSEYLAGVVAEWGIARKNITVVYNAFSVEELLATKDEIRRMQEISGPMLLSAGRFVPWKGFSTLIALMPTLRQTFPNLTLRIAGTGPDEEALKAAIEKNNAGEYARLLGSIPHRELTSLVRAADCFVLNTGYEGLSHQLLEVMATGTPIVTTAIGGNPELIENCVSGLLVPYDDTAKLSAAITRMLSDRIFADSCAAKAKERAAGFSVERAVSGVIMLLQETIGIRA
jgi:glycosyltransferase involved in cell wall biosynthesis